MATGEGSRPGILPRRAGIADEAREGPVESDPVYTSDQPNGPYRHARNSLSCHAFPSRTIRRCGRPDITSPSGRATLLRRRHSGSGRPGPGDAGVTRMNRRAAKAAVKRAAELAVAKTAPLLWRRRHGSLVVLMYHRVLPPGDPRLEAEQPGMYVHPATLRFHLATLKRHFQPVRLDHWILAARNNAPLPERAFAITFDDGWADNFEYAYPVLTEEDVPATIFVVSDLVGTGCLFWPERLGLLLQQGLARHAAQLYSFSEFAWLRALDMPMPSSGRELDPERLDRIINGAKRDDDATLCGRVDAMASRLGDAGSSGAAQILSWEQIRTMAGSGLISVGSHTRRHTRLSDALTPERLHDEIAGSRLVIESNAGCEAPLFCYPNGDVTATVRSLVAEHYLAACSTLPGWHSIAADRYMIRRISVHQDITRDETSFLARLSGWI